MGGDTSGIVLVTGTGLQLTGTAPAFVVLLVSAPSMTLQPGGIESSLMGSVLPSVGETEEAGGVGEVVVAGGAGRGTGELEFSESGGVIEEIEVGATEGGGVAPWLMAVGGEGGEAKGNVGGSSHRVASSCSQVVSIEPSSRTT